MGCDLVVALGSATAHGQTLFGVNLHGPAGPWTLRRCPGGGHVPDEKVHLRALDLPQGRQTFTVVGLQAEGAWGLQHGVNEHHLAIGCAAWRTKLAGTSDGLAGPDLVRLVLERCRTASQALALLTDLIARHGQSLPPRGHESTDHVFLLADSREAFVVEAAGSHWACQECQRVRAVCDVGLIRQDWQRLSPGLAGAAIAKGWWPDDGSKLDFGAALSLPLPNQAWALKRWGRASLLLEQQTGHLDLALLRRLLAEHYESHFSSAKAIAEAPLGLAASLTANLSATDGPTVLWWSFGPPVALHLPVFLDGDLPLALDRRHADHLYGKVQTMQAEAERPQGRSLRKALERLQARIDQETDEFLAEARGYQAGGETGQLGRLAGLFMQNHVELVETEWRRWRGLPEGNARRGVSADALAYVAE